MAQASHKTVTERLQGANASAGEILTPTLPCEKDLTVEEIILTPPDNLESQVHDAQDSGGGPVRTDHPRRRSRDLSNVLSITSTSTPGTGIYFRRLEPFTGSFQELDFLTEGGVLRVCSGLRSPVSMIDSACSDADERAG